MKCSNPDCNRGIGLVAYRRGWSASVTTVQGGKSSVDEDQEKLISNREAPSSFAKSAMLAALVSDCGGWLSWSLRQQSPIGVTN